jgi:hypothetical protein
MEPVFVSRDASGNITGIFANAQPGYATEQISITDPTVIAFLARPPIMPTTIAVNSTSSPALNGSYAFDATTQSKMLAVSLYISVNGKFPAGQTTFPWPDASGAMHSFTTTAQFRSLATALADYATALVIGQAPTAPVTIP